MSETSQGFSASSEAAKVAGGTAPAETTDATPKKRGRPAGSTNRKRKSAIDPQKEQMAHMLNGVAFSLVGALGGPDALPDKKEAEALNTALTAYLHTKADLVVSPGWILMGVYAQFFIVKFAQPKPKERLALVAKAVALKIRGAWMKARHGFSPANMENEDNEPDGDQTGGGRDNGTRRGWGFTRNQEPVEHETGKAH